MTFDEFYFIEGQPVKGHINTIVDPFLYTPPVGYPNGYPPNGFPTYPHLPNTPLDLLPIHKNNLHVSIKEEKKKRRRKKLLKLMLISQLMNSQK